MPVRSTADLDEKACGDLANTPESALLVIPDLFLNDRRALIATLAVRHRLPAVAAALEFPRLGGLMAYGLKYSTRYAVRRPDVDRILRGENVGKLPIQAPIKFRAGSEPENCQSAQASDP